MKKRLTKKQMWLFALGQLGWSILSGIIGIWLVTFYNPGSALINEGFKAVIYQGGVIGAVTIIGLITAGGRVLDAITDPVIASASDRSTNPKGRRLPFMKKAAVPLAVVTVLVFCVPNGSPSILNTVWLTLALVLFYISITSYCAPYNALISEFGANQEDRIAISTFISFTFILGYAFAYLVPNIAGMLSGFDLMTGYRIAIGILSALALVFLLIPTLTLNETDFIDIKPSDSKAFNSLAKTYKNKYFRVFIFSDVFYWIGITIFNTGLFYYVTELLHFDASLNFVFFALLTLVSVLCYPIVGKLSKKHGKKVIVILAYFIIALSFVTISFSNGGSVVDGATTNSWIFMIIIVLLASFPMAILGILPQAIVADVAQYDSLKTGEERQGMFFAARTFNMKLGQGLALLLFTAVASVGAYSSINEGTNSSNIEAITTNQTEISALVVELKADITGDDDSYKIDDTFVTELAELETSINSIANLIEDKDTNIVSEMLDYENYVSDYYDDFSNTEVISEKNSAVDSIKAYLDLIDTTSTGETSSVGNTGLRVSAIVAACLAAAGGIILFFYKEKDVTDELETFELKEKNKLEENSKE